MYNKSLKYLLLGVLLGGCSGPYVVDEVNVEDGVVAGEESLAVDGSGQVTAVGEEGYIPENRYLDDYETGDVNLGPNAPGYIP